MALKKYANEHPRNKKLSKDKTKKLAKAKLKPSKWLIEEYNANVKEGYKGSIKKYILEFYGPEYLMSKGGLIDKPLGAGGKKSGPPPKRGPNPQGLNIKSNTAKTVKLEK